MNSTIHWIGLEDSRIICYFDVEKEEFGSSPLPSHFGKGIIDLEVMDNRLYIHHVRPIGSVRKFWAMKDYGDFGSWTLEWVIDEQLIGIFNGHVKPLKSLKDGMLLMMISKAIQDSGDLPETIIRTLASYSSQTRALKKIN